MEFNNQALILKVGRFREADLWVKFFSRDQGLLTAFAFGGCRSRRRFCGCLDSMNQVHFKIRRSGPQGYLCLMEGLLLSSPNRLRQNPSRLGLAANCLKFMEAAVPGPIGAPKAYNLGLETLKLLDADEETPAALPALFKAGILFEQGLGPNLTHCSVCGKHPSNGGSLNVEMGLITCYDCPPVEGMRINLSTAALKALSSAASARPSQWPGFVLDPASRQALNQAVDGLVSYHLGLAWGNGRFRHN